MERSIPHVRDIFAPYRAAAPTKVQEVFVYEHSPGSRRRRLDAYQEYRSDPEDGARTGVHPPKESNARRNNHRSNEQQRLLTEKDRNTANRCQEKGNYSSKTLTDRDIRHLERHLSMKKTIRKQISRNLAQAFVEDPQLVLNSSEGQVLPPQPPPTHQKSSENYTFTLTRAKMARSDTPAFLDMLKDEKSQASEADSGHSSPSNHQDDSDDVDFDDKIIVHRTANKNVDRGNAGSDVKRPTSFWKKLGFKGKGKR